MLCLKNKTRHRDGLKGEGAMFKKNKLSILIYGASNCLGVDESCFGQANTFPYSHSQFVALDQLLIHGSSANLGTKPKAQIKQITN